MVILVIRGHDVKAQNTFVLAGNAELDGDRTPLAFYAVPPILLDQLCLRPGPANQRRFVPIRAFIFAKHKKDIDIF